MSTVKNRPVKLRAVESFIEGYKPLTSQDIKNMDRLSYEDLQKQLRSDVVKAMVEAADLGMNLEQYANLRSPETIVNQKRSAIARLMEDEGMYVRTTTMSAASTVAECMDGDLRQALLFHTLSKAWDSAGIQDRSSSITLPGGTQVGTGINQTTTSTPPPVAAGLDLNPGELVANTHSIGTNNYNPFKWDYDDEDMQRTKVKPGETIPPSTLAETEGNIPMEKWGNRFVLPYEMLTGGQGLRVNKLTSMVQLDAAQESTRQYAELLKVLQDGDGVTGAATVEGIKAKYGASAAKFEFVAFLNWLDEAMEAPFQISHVIMLSAEQREMRKTLAALEGNQAFNQLTSVGLAPSRLTNMSDVGGIRYGKAPAGSLTANYILGVDSRYAVERVNRAGMAIRQQAEQIANQTREVVVSDTYLWARLAEGAVKVLNVGA